MPLDLVVVSESQSHLTEHVLPNFPRDPRFNPAWWDRGSAKSPVSYCQLLEVGEEVARAKILPRAGSYLDYPSWHSPPGGVTEVDLIEVRPDLRCTGLRYGARAVEMIGVRYGRPMVAMSLDESSDGFWRRLGWLEHRRLDDEGARRLFSSS